MLRLCACAVVLGFALSSVAQPDVIPAEISVNVSYDIVRSGVVGDPNCRLLLGGTDVGGCETGEPLRGRLRAPAGYPPGSQTLICRNCREASPPTTVPTVPTDEPIIMPDLTGLDIETAANILDDLGWDGDFNNTQEDSEPEQYDRIVEQTPPAGAELAPDELVSLVFGREPVVEIPTCCGFRRVHRAEVVLGTITVLASGATPTALTAPTAPTPSPSETGVDDSVGQPEPAAGTWPNWLLPAMLALLLLIVAISTLFIRRHGPGPPRDPVDTPDGDAGMPGIRDVRVYLADADTPRQPARRDQPLVPSGAYVLTVEIGPLPGAELAVPLAVVVFDGPTRVLTASPVREVRLSGAAVPPIGFELRTPSQPSGFRLRCGLFCRGVLLQSFVVDATVGPRGTPGGWRSDRDYVTSFGLDPRALTGLVPHELSLMINHSTPDEHGVYAYFGNRRVAMTGRIPSGHIRAQQELAHRMYESTGTARYDLTRLAPLLGALARVGADLHSMLMTSIDPALEQRQEDPGQLWDELRGPARVQVAWPQGSACPLPAAVVYDFGLSEDVESANTVLCRYFFDDLNQRSQIRCLAGGCLSTSDEVVCPAGFWGFRLLLGCQPSCRPAAPVPDVLAERPEPRALVLGKGTGAEFRLRDNHLTWLRDQLPTVHWYEEHSRRALVDCLRTVQPSLIYLYGHGGVDRERGIGWVEVGAGERLSMRSLGAEFRSVWRSRPLVLLNGCSTAALGDDVPNALTPKLLWAGAAGVIGAEIDITEGLACAFADTLVPRLLLSGSTVGEAVRSGRLALLGRGSPLGLCFVAFAPVDLRLT